MIDIDDIHSSLESVHVDNDPQYLQLHDHNVTNNAPTQVTNDSIQRALDADDCPDITCRIGNALHLVFPLPESFPCTENGCSSILVIQKWYSMKQSLTRHLNDYHDVNKDEITVIKLCKLCRTHSSFTRLENIPDS